MSIGLINSLLLVGLFVVYVVASCFGLYLMKEAESWRSQAFVMGLFLYALGAGIWIAILRLAPLSVAFPIAAGALMIGTIVTGAMLLAEPVTFWHVTGALLIISGIALIAGGR